MSKNVYASFLDQVLHVHQWKDNDTGSLGAVGYPGATINGTCIGAYACTGEYSGLNNHGSGSVSSGIDFIIDLY